MNGSTNRHLCLINYYFPPFGGGGVQRWLKLLKYWPEENPVTVLTVKPSYFYAYDEALAAEIPSFVRVVRSGSADPFRLIYLLRKILPLKTKTGNNQKTRESSGRFRKISAFLFIPDSRILWLPFAMIKLYKIHRERQIDLLIATAPPFTSALIGTLFSRFTGVPLVLDMRDAWTNNPYLPEISETITKIQTRLEAAVFKTAAAAVFVNPKLRTYYLNKYKFLEKRPNSVIRNGFDPDDFNSIVRSAEKCNPSHFKIGIMGTIYSQGNAPYPLLDAVKQLRQTDPNLAEKLKIIFIGKWAGDFFNRISEMGIGENCEFISYRPHREALAMAISMDMLALAIEDRGPGSENVTPGRIYEYLALRRPVLAMGPPDSDMKKLIEETGCGYFFEYNQTKKLLSELIRWIKNPGRLPAINGNNSLAGFNRIEQAQQYFNFVSKLFKD